MIQSNWKHTYIRGFSLILISLIVGINIGSKEIDAWMRHIQQEKYPSQNVSIETCFTPQQKCMPKIIQQIGLAKESILMRMYAFTSRDVAEALIKAHQRGVTVIVMCDKGQAQQKYAQEKWLKGQGIEVHYETTKGYAHNKVMIIDHRIVITGSYNYTTGAEHRNAENLIIIQDIGVVNRYLQDFQHGLRSSKQ